eukprot:gene9544-biopygen5797
MMHGTRCHNHEGGDATKAVCPRADRLGRTGAGPGPNGPEGVPCGNCGAGRVGTEKKTVEIQPRHDRTADSGLDWTGLDWTECDPSIRTAKQPSDSLAIVDLRSSSVPKRASPGIPLGPSGPGPDRGPDGPPKIRHA